MCREPFTRHGPKRHWLTGLLPAENLLLYSDAEQAVHDLQRSRIDMVISDAEESSASVIANADNLKIVAQELMLSTSDGCCERRQRAASQP